MGDSQAAPIFDNMMIADWEVVEMGDLTREEMDARLDAAVSKVQTIESRIEATLTEFSADNRVFKKDVALRLDVMAAEIKHLPSTWTLMGTIAASTAAVITIVLGVIAFGSDRFDGGVQASSIVAAQSAETRQAAKDNADQIKILVDRANKNDAKFDAILDYLKKEPQK